MSIFTMLKDAIKFLCHPTVTIITLLYSFFNLICKFLLELTLSGNMLAPKMHFQVSVLSLKRKNFYQLLMSIKA